MMLGLVGPRVARMRMIANSLGIRERMKFGQVRRRRLKRSDQGRWEQKRRSHDPIDIILATNQERIPELVPIKMARMALSPFTFFRGDVAVMAADLAVMPSTGITVQICGDAHVRNLGAFAAPDGRLVFDINDFDETVRAPFEWDLKRLATSLTLAGRALAAKNSACEEAVLAFTQRYWKFIETFSRMPVTEVARYQVHRLQRISPVSKALLKAERSTPLHNLDHLTTPPSAPVEKRKFKDLPPLLS